jgi:hypothetical protein
LRLASDKPQYGAGEVPKLTLTVVDMGTKSCHVDLGTKSTSVTVLANGKPVWSSNACQTDQSKQVQLSPASAQALSLNWDRTNNTVGCGAQAQALQSGVYELVAKVGNASAYGGSITLGS